MAEAARVRRGRASRAAPRAASRVRRGAADGVLRRRSADAGRAVSQQRVRHRGRTLRGRPHAPSSAAARSRARRHPRLLRRRARLRRDRPVDAGASLRTHRRAGDRSRAWAGLLRTVRALRRRGRAADARGLRPARDADVRPGAGRVPHQRRAGGAGRSRRDRLPAAVSPIRPWSTRSPRCTRRMWCCCTPAEHAAFVGNAIALSPDTRVDERAGRPLADAGHREALRGAGFEVATVELDAIEAGGGSLRCCVGEIF